MVVLHVFEGNIGMKKVSIVFTIGSRPPFLHTRASTLTTSQRNSGSPHSSLSSMFSPDAAIAADAANLCDHPAFMISRTVKRFPVAKKAEPVASAKIRTMFSRVVALPAAANGSAIPLASKRQT